MGNRTTHAQSPLGSRYSEPSFSTPLRVARPSQLSRRRSSTVRQYFRPPSSSLSDYLQAHSSEYHGFGPQFEEEGEHVPQHDAYSQLRELVKKHNTITHSTSSGLHNIANQSEYSGRRENKWFHEMRPRGDRKIRGTEDIIKGGTGEVRSSFTTELDESSSSTSDDDIAMEEPQMKVTQQSHHSRIGEMRSVSSASREWKQFRSRQPKPHNGYIFSDTKSSDMSDYSSRSGSRTGTRPVRTASTKQDRFARGDLNEGSSVSINRNKCESQRSISACTSTSRDRLDNSRSSRGFSNQLGFQTQPDGMLTYTAFVRAGPSGIPVKGWLTELRKRASRHLIGLNRQFHCTIKFEPEPLFYRGSFVHTLSITGQRQSDLIRYRNALPACIEKYLITPFAHHRSTIRAR